MVVIGICMFAMNGICTSAVNPDAVAAIMSPVIQFMLPQSNIGADAGAMVPMPQVEVSWQTDDGCACACACTCAAGPGPPAGPGKKSESANFITSQPPAEACCCGNGGVGTGCHVTSGAAPGKPCKVPMVGEAPQPMAGEAPQQPKIGEAAAEPHKAGDSPYPEELAAGPGKTGVSRKPSGASLRKASGAKKGGTLFGGVRRLMVFRGLSNCKTVFRTFGDRKQPPSSSSVRRERMESGERQRLGEVGGESSSGTVGDCATQAGMKPTSAKVAACSGTVGSLLGVFAGVGVATAAGQDGGAIGRKFSLLAGFGEENTSSPRILTGSLGLGSGE
mmetsp:Transcript_61741/g.177072  ORF Transcript_61741/g.177072 Transcript_61741/m.177072 type:complete len:333 (-) Transcript_61741:187-1185(-)